MSENVGASTSRNPKDLYGLYRDNFTFAFINASIKERTKQCTNLQQHVDGPDDNRVWPKHIILAAEINTYNTIVGKTHSNINIKSRENKTDT
jgi:hypothetical protein